MKILHIYWSLTTGGIETMLPNIANEQLKLNHEVHVIIINNLIENKIKDLFDKGVKMYFLNRKLHSKNPFFMIKLNILERKINPDVIHLHATNIYNILPLSSQRKKICATIHTIPTIWKNKELPNIRLYFSISKIVQKTLFEKFHKTSTVIANGIYLEKYVQKKQYDNPIRKIVQIGRLYHEIKGQDILIKAISLLKKDNINVTLTLIGDGESTVYLKDLVNKLGLNEQVFFIGTKNQEYIQNHLHEYDLLVQPSRLEGFGLTVIEGIAAKIPVLVSENDGPLEILENGDLGYTFKRESVDDCYIKLKQIISIKTNQDLIEKAYQHVLEKYDIRKTAYNYIEEYKKIL